MQLFGLAIPGFHLIHIAWLSNGTHLAFVGLPTDGRPSVPIMGIIDSDNVTIIKYLDGVTGGIAASPYNDEVAVVTNQGVYIISLANETISAPVPLNSFAAETSGDIAWSPDGQFLAVTGSDPASRSATNPMQLLLILNRSGEVVKMLRSPGMMLHLAWSADSQQLAFRHLPGMHVRFFSVNNVASKIAAPFSLFFYPCPRPGTGAMVLVKNEHCSKLAYMSEDRTINLATYMNWEVEKPPQRVWWSRDGELCLFQYITKFTHRWRIFRASTLRDEPVITVVADGELTSPSWSPENNLAFVHDGQVLFVDLDIAASV